MTALNWAFRPLAKYAVFAGRASRPEYWWFYLFCLLLVAASVCLDGLLGTRVGQIWGYVSISVNLALVMPSLAVAARRLHDADLSGWWLLLIFMPLALLVLFARAGTPGPNRFGPETD